MLTSVLLCPVISNAGRPPREDAAQVTLGDRRGDGSQSVLREGGGVSPLQGHPFGGASHAARSTPVSAIFPASLSSPGPIILGEICSLGGSLVPRGGFQVGLPSSRPALQTRTKPDWEVGQALEQRRLTEVRRSGGGTSGFKSQVAIWPQSCGISCFDFFPDSLRGRRRLHYSIRCRGPWLGVDRGWPLACPMGCKRGTEPTLPHSKLFPKLSFKCHCFSLILVTRIICQGVHLTPMGEKRGKRGTVQEFRKGPWDGSGGSPMNVPS